jgi:hypothetical protein
VRIEARVARNAELLERLDANQLDLALVWGDPASASLMSRAGIDSDAIAQVPMQWIAAVGAGDVGVADAGAMPDAARDGAASAAAERTPGAEQAEQQQAERGEPLPLVVSTGRAASSPRRPTRSTARACRGASHSPRRAWPDYGRPRRPGWASRCARITGCPRRCAHSTAACGLPALPSLPLLLLRRTSSATPTVERLAQIVTQAVRDATRRDAVALAA